MLERIAFINSTALEKFGSEKLLKKNKDSCNYISHNAECANDIDSSHTASLHIFLLIQSLVITHLLPPPRSAS